MEQYLANANFGEMAKNGHNLENLVFVYFCTCMMCKFLHLYSMQLACVHYFVCQWRWWQLTQKLCSKTHFLMPHHTYKGKQTVDWLFNMHNAWFLWISVYCCQDERGSSTGMLGRHSLYMYRCEHHVCTWCLHAAGWAGFRLKYTAQLE